ncbi:MAG: phosphohistidine phosphatase SixA [Hyphomicrobiales bacterium]|nr:phosphohistidine phosphatase SixA [Hyphomicrobiales bacterium]MCP5373122.1 phosphohistidine phosphatase SixA [Hyphomicrobiales bacterium]
MKLYLVQHGEATTVEEDSERPLTAQGRADVEKVARFMAAAGVHADRVFHSGILRAQQTAEILAKAVCPENEPTEAPMSIAPKDQPGALADEANHWGDDVMVVGHLPFMARAASLLAAGSPGVKAVAFRPGTVVCLERPEDSWAVAWMVRPELLK